MLLKSIIIRLLKGTENHVVESITVIQQRNGRKNNIVPLAYSNVCREGTD